MQTSYPAVIYCMCTSLTFVRQTVTGADREHQHDAESRERELNSECHAAGNRLIWPGPKRADQGQTALISGHHHIQSNSWCAKLEEHPISHCLRQRASSNAQLYTDRCCASERLRTANQHFCTMLCTERNKRAAGCYTHKHRGDLQNKRLRVYESARAHG